MTAATVGEAVRYAERRLREAGCSSPRIDANLLASHHLGIESSQLFFHLSDELPRPELFTELIDRRARREPLQHIVGSAPFGPLNVHVGSGVFIPRPETEVLAEWAIRTLRGMIAAGEPAPRVVDLCTGSGALACWIAMEIPEACVIAVEKDPTARRYAECNAAAHPTVTVISGDATNPELLRELDGSVSLVVSNPPYVPEGSPVSPEVAADPHAAVFGGVDGMNVISAMVPVIARLLRPGGHVGIEHDDTTSVPVREALDGTGCFEPSVPLADLNGVARFALARRR